jgi:hypothetical protein
MDAHCILCFWEREDDLFLLNQHRVASNTIALRIDCGSLDPTLTLLFLTPSNESRKLDSIKAARDRIRRRNTNLGASCEKIWQTGQ